MFLQACDLRVDVGGFAVKVDVVFFGEMLEKLLLLLGGASSQGDVRAHLLTVGETATIKGEIVADDIVVNGRVVGRVRGLKVRLTSTARVEGDIIHKTIAIESGAHFEGSVQRQDDPLQGANAPKLMAPAAEAPFSGQ